ncbi:MAG TPA: carboxypeptidase-like regulatory domain-containing protein, partial [Ferruginibacter sp.]|nr:carboxypeptidase-like regulatory domain-containing protein [Ferruginibacter sp.]
AVPANENLVVSVFSYYNCGNAVYTQNFSTTTVDLSLGNITIGNGSNTYANISGTVTDCSNNPVTNGYVIVYNDSRYSRYDVDASGNFSFDQLICGNSSSTATIIAIDNNNIQQSAPITFTMASGPITIGNIQACANSIAEFITWTFDGGTSTTLSAPVDSLQQYGTGTTANFLISGSSNNNPSGGNISLYIDNTNIGVGSVQTLMYIYCNQLTTQNQTVSNNPVVHITEYGAIGEFIAGNFSANIVDNSTSQTHTIVCSFRVRRNL